MIRLNCEPFHQTSQLFPKDSFGEHQLSTNAITPLIIRTDFRNPISILWWMNIHSSKTTDRYPSMPDSFYYICLEEIPGVKSVAADKWFYRKELISLCWFYKFIVWNLSLGYLSLIKIYETIIIIYNLHGIYFYHQLWADTK